MRTLVLVIVGLIFIDVAIRGNVGSFFSAIAYPDALSEVGS